VGSGYGYFLPSPQVVFLVLFSFGVLFDVKEENEKIVQCSLFDLWQDVVCILLQTLVYSGFSSDPINLLPFTKYFRNAYQRLPNPPCQILFSELIRGVDVSLSLFEILFLFSSSESNFFYLFSCLCNFGLGFLVLLPLPPSSMLVFFKASLLDSLVL
jgi:hypothetical protein